VKSSHTLDVVVFSHLRWDFVFQRPQHLLTRCARERSVFYIEEPLFEPDCAPTLEVSERAERLFVAVPHLPSGLSPEESRLQMRGLVDELFTEHVNRRFVAWYYTPMALAFSDHLKPATVVYDCMDELSNFKAAPPELRTLEDRLFRLADVVFTGGFSLYEQKCSKHSNVHPFPSSVDSGHFRKARKPDQDPQDQSAISRPRIGYSGVIDERLDIALVRDLAQARRDWQFVMLGPVVKIDPSTLPRAENIHYLGPKSYSELPAYLSGWDVAIMPFARNDATRFISPTKTPEYLAAGRRVVSTSIRDVVRSYGEAGLALIADEVHGFGAAIERSLRAPRSDPGWIAQVDAYLERMSWNQTFYDMWRLVEKALAQRAMRTLARPVRSRVSAPGFAAPAATSHSPIETADANLPQ
jgi:UDP-galactopyranose mutase